MENIFFTWIGHEFGQVIEWFVLDRGIVHSVFLCVSVPKLFFCHKLSVTELSQQELI